MKISIYQMDVIAGKPELNRGKVKDWLEVTCKKEKPDVVVLPEMWTTNYTLKHLNNIADRDGEPTTSFLQHLAKTYEVNIVGGSFANRKGGNIYNSAVVINRHGEVVYRYDKVHLVPMLDEHLYLTGGTTYHTFDLEGLKAGLIICYDLRFPELSRKLAVDGAEILFIVAEWPETRKSHWFALQIARAIENQLFVVSANCVGQYNGISYCGNSMVIDPLGEVLYCASDKNEESITKEIDIKQVSEIREKVPVFKSRVPHLYKLNTLE
ncbi:carbon-nitrogen hydrolase [Anaerobacillus alkalidiazotrophicus]|uniref:Carbon-nitrogen hydrolase n=1 Tax=Anaerobacillus alkalidiazotrophicus TaxID=472963 RepID=A0A1S2M4Q9_9BACI|nr:carbon-nitrogen family hydrolase [Anaerobacillus alkalidiazotrophicus]OIJ19443.1 carbon-nitrogen hydrolase [Anaerobacillus alkalidiazotrophicus]